MKADAGGFKDQRVRVESDQASAYNREHEKAEPTWAGTTGSDKIYFTRLSRDEHRLDLCVADAAARLCQAEQLLGVERPRIEFDRLARAMNSQIRIDLVDIAHGISPFPTDPGVILSSPPADVLKILYLPTGSRAAATR